MARQRATSVTSHYTQPRGSNPAGLFVINGAFHPSQMPEPGEEGYRTPTGEDLAFHFPSLRHRLVNALYDNSPQLESGSESSSRIGSRREAVPIPAAGEERSNKHAATSSRLSHDDEKQNFSNQQQNRSDTRKDEPPINLGWRERLRHYTWSYFTITMATGGIANVLWHVPFRFRGLYEIGCIFFLLNVVLFLINVTCISLRFYWHPSTFVSSFIHPTESLFAPAAVVSFGSILLNISQYGKEHVGAWLNTGIMVLFWVDLGLAFIASFGTYLLFWSTQTFTIANMTPIWIFPVYPLLIIGPHAAVLSSILEPTRSAQVLVGGFTAQGIGFLVSLMIYSAYIYRLMTQKLPLERMRPGMFVSVGPSAFTASGISNMAANAQRTWAGTDFMGNGDLASMVLRIVGDWSALWLWGLAVWFFFVAVGAHYSVAMGRTSFPFAMTWFSFVFPQTALVTATFAIAKAFNIRAMQILGCVMTVALICMWTYVVFMMIRAFFKKQILWPQKGEDKDEGGFRGDSSTKARRGSQQQLKSKANLEPDTTAQMA